MAQIAGSESKDGVTSFAGPALAVVTQRGAWVALYWYSFLAVQALACAIPHRAVTPQRAA